MTCLINVLRTGSFFLLFYDQISYVQHYVDHELNDQQLLMLDETLDLLQVKHEQLPNLAASA